MPEARITKFPVPSDSKIMFLALTAMSSSGCEKIDGSIPRMTTKRQ
jgi:hypothetical protein